MGKITWRDRKPRNPVSVNTQPHRLCSIEFSALTLSTLVDPTSLGGGDAESFGFLSAPSLLEIFSVTAHRRKQSSTDVLSALRCAVSSTLGMTPRRRRTLGAPPSRSFADETPKSP